MGGRGGALGRLADRVVPGRGRRRAERALAEALGEGVWRRAHDRVHRSVDRFHQVLDGVVADDAPGARDSLVPALETVAADLVDLLGTVEVLCVRAQAVAPSAGLDVPRVPPAAAAEQGLPDELHRRLSRAGTAAATASEAATMARVSARAGALDVALDRARAAARAVATAREHLGTAPR